MPATRTRTRAVSSTLSSTSVLPSVAWMACAKVASRTTPLSWARRQPVTAD